MKKFILLLVLMPLLAFASTVSVTDLDNVFVNGLNSGKMEDVVKNYPSDADAVKASASAWWHNLVVDAKPQMQMASDNMERLVAAGGTVSQEDKDAILEWRSQHP